MFVLAPITIDPLTSNVPVIVTFEPAGKVAVIPDEIIKRSLAPLKLAAAFPPPLVPPVFQFEAVWALDAPVVVKK